MGACSRETRTSPRGRSGSPRLLWTRETVWGSLARELNVETPETLDDVPVRKACVATSGDGEAQGTGGRRSAETRGALSSHLNARRKDARGVATGNTAQNAPEASGVAGKGVGLQARRGLHGRGTPSRGPTETSRLKNVWALTPC